MPHKLGHTFDHFASRTARVAGSAYAFQHSSNKDSEAIQVKLDEIIAATRGASNRLIAIEHREDDELEALEQRFERLARRAKPCPRNDA
ncbi:MAG TPA: low affinity iron permease family protein [Microthrixaceae bacterium]|nr:low affinity iron permease family protein [Microthrixaceae bacterium]